MAVDSVDDAGWLEEVGQRKGEETRTAAKVCPARWVVKAESGSADEGEGLVGCHGVNVRKIWMCAGGPPGG